MGTDGTEDENLLFSFCCFVSLLLDLMQGSYIARLVTPKVIY